MVSLPDNSFQEFVNSPCMTEIKERSCFIHIDVPGHDENADKLPDRWEDIFERNIAGYLFLSTSVLSKCELGMLNWMWDIAKINFEEKRRKKAPVIKYQFHFMMVGLLFAREMKTFNAYSALGHASVCSILSVLRSHGSPVNSWV